MKRWMLLPLLFIGALLTAPAMAEDRDISDRMLGGSYLLAQNTPPENPPPPEVAPPGQQPPDSPLPPDGNFRKWKKKRTFGYRQVYVWS